MPSSRDSSRPRDPQESLKSSALAGGFFTTIAPWEALSCALGCISLVPESLRHCLSIPRVRSRVEIVEVHRPCVYRIRCEGQTFCFLVTCRMCTISLG